MKSLSSIDVHYLARELQGLVGSRVDNIYQKGKEEFLIQMHKSGEGKKLLRILVGKMMFLASLKEEMESLSGFCMLLRKYLGNSTLHSITQVEPERIVRLEFWHKEDVKLLYLEFFGKGNVILCTKENLIIDALAHHEFKDRKVGPKETYKWPTMRYDAFSMEADHLSSLLFSTTKESLVKCLAIEMGLGGVYAEEACAMAELDKNAKPAKINEKEAIALLTSLKKLTGGNPSPIIYLKDGKVNDVTPFPLQTLAERDSLGFSTFSEALSHYASHFSPEEKSSYDSKMEELRRIIMEQEKAIIELTLEEEGQRAKAEAIYSNYMQVKAILDELNIISKKHSWQEIKEKLKGHAVIKDVNPKEKSVVVELS